MDKKLRLKAFDKNEKGRDFIVGDIHGWFNVLDKQLIEINFDKEKDRLFALGDLIDRGPYSHKCLEYLDQPWFFSILGNHEVMLYEYHNNISWLNSYEKHGGNWFIDLPKARRQKYVDRLYGLDHIFEIDTINGIFGMVHAEIPNNDWDMFKLYFDKFAEDSVWSFDLFNAHQVGLGNGLIRGIDYVVHGHSGVSKPMIIENKIYIDTGAANKRLVLMEINNSNGIIYHQ